MDFYNVKVRKLKGGRFEIYPEFIIGDSDELMIRGKDFYAVYDSATGMWNRNPLFIQKTIDQDLWKRYEELVNSGIDKSSLEVKTI